MTADPNDNNTNEPKAARGGDLRRWPDKQPTPSLLTHKVWLELMKEHMRSWPPKHEEFLGPFFRESAPYRAKITLPYEEGKIIVLKGRVWSCDDKTPLEATVDVWQADIHGRYDNEEPIRALDERTFINRSRVRCDEEGNCEFETVHPGAYKRGTTWQAPHIHLRVKYPGYIICVTQLIFRGDPHFDEDPFRECSIIVDLKEVEHNGEKYKEGTFEIVLAPEP
jgi:protocatechuate 3,4-dioxygenase beta subunit